MTTLRRGMRGVEVAVLQDKLTQAGFGCGPIDGIFGGGTDIAVKAFQKHKGLTTDGIVGNQTWAALDAIAPTVPVDPSIIDTYAEVIALPCGLPRNERDRRFSDALKLQQTCDGGQGFHYCGWSNPYLYGSKEFRAGDLGFPMPDGSISSVAPGHDLKAPLHGGTCSPWTGWFMGWWLAANGDFNFRVGRSASYIVDWPHDKIYKNTKIPGFAEYCESDGTRLRKASMSTLYTQWEWLNQVNVLPMSHHIVLAIKVGGDDGFWLEDPHNPGQPIPSGIYRFGADGNYPVVGGKKFYSGARQTWRRMTDRESVGQSWRTCRVTNNSEITGTPEAGPFGGRPSWELT